MAYGHIDTGMICNIIVCTGYRTPDIVPLFRKLCLSMVVAGWRMNFHSLVWHKARSQGSRFLGEILPSLRNPAQKC